MQCKADGGVGASFESREAFDVRSSEVRFAESVGVANAQISLIPERKSSNPERFDRLTKSSGEPVLEAV